MFRVLVGLGVLFVGLGALFLVGGVIKGPGQAITQGTILITAGLTVLAIYEIHHRLVKLRESFESLERRQNQILDVLMRQNSLSSNHVLNGIRPPAPVEAAPPIASPSVAPVVVTPETTSEPVLPVSPSLEEGVPADESEKH